VRYAIPFLSNKELGGYHTESSQKPPSLLKKSSPSSTVKGMEWLSTHRESWADRSRKKIASTDKNNTLPCSRESGVASAIGPARRF